MTGKSVTKGTRIIPASELSRCHPILLDCLRVAKLLTVVLYGFRSEDEFFFMQIRSFTPYLSFSTLI